VCKELAGSSAGIVWLLSVACQLHGRPVKGFSLVITTLSKFYGLSFQCK